jgi:hypothetical protein|nr:MAG TPA: hypothetical protein [Caudoviricetes sp.]
MLTTSQTDYLLSLPKYVVNKDGDKMDVVTVDIDAFYDHRILLQVVNDDTISDFLLRIRRSKKYTLNLTLHVQDNESKDCIVRIDYGASHTNPTNILETLPEKFHSFAGQILHEPHMHYNIDGYKVASWALPLSEANFSPDKLENLGFRVNFREAIYNFVQFINVQTPILVDNPNKLFS